MRLAYVDSSLLLAIQFKEPEWSRWNKVLAGFDKVVSSGLVEAEFKAACLRERSPLLEYPVRLGLILPPRGLQPEIDLVLDHGYLRGADCWHLATALYLRDQDSEGLAFLTLDRPQGRIAEALGFEVPRLL